MDIVTTFTAPGIVFLLTVATGLWLTRSGKPLKPAIFTVHKLIALAAVVLAVLRTFNALEIVEVQPILIALIVLIGLCAAALFATGALMSMGKPAYGALLTIHKVALLLAIIAGAAVIHLLGST